MTTDDDFQYLAIPASPRTGRGHGTLPASANLFQKEVMTQGSG
jgi:hypothetical protein